MKLLCPRLTLVLGLAGASLVLPALIAPAPAQAAQKKPKKPAPAAKAAKPAADEKVTAQSILQWKKQGMTDDEIVARAQEAGYSPSAKDKAALQKGKASKALIAGLEGGGGAGGGPKPINLKQLTDPNDIDFDSVPPPNNMPKKYVDKQQAEKKPKLDHSERPSAPFDEKAAAAAKHEEERAKAEPPAKEVAKAKGKAKAEPEEKPSTSAAAKLQAAMKGGKGKKGKPAKTEVEAPPEPPAKSKRVVFTGQ